jgi:hypothetical protein
MPIRFALGGFGTVTTVLIVGLLVYPHMNEVANHEILVVPTSPISSPAPAIAADKTGHSTVAPPVLSTDPLLAEKKSLVPSMPGRGELQRESIRVAVRKGGAEIRIAHNPTVNVLHPAAVSVVASNSLKNAHPGKVEPMEHRQIVTRLNTSSLLTRPALSTEPIHVEPKATSIEPSRVDSANSESLGTHVALATRNDAPDSAAAVPDPLPLTHATAVSAVEARHYTLKDSGTERPKEARFLVGLDVSGSKSLSQNEHFAALVSAPVK